MSVIITVSVILGIILVIWIATEFKRAKHKVLAIALIALILFFYISVTSVLKGKQIDLGSVDGITNAIRIYLSWLASAFTNVKAFTANVAKITITNSTK